MRRSKKPDDFLTLEENAQVKAAIAKAEAESSAEVKLIIARHCWMDIRKKAMMLFHKHGLDRTKHRNCVLILLITTNREFLIYGDKGIHAKVGQAFWHDVRGLMMEAFKEDQFGDGLAGGIARIGGMLAQYFPHEAGDKNEIPDEVSHEE